ncbi:MAG: tRNA (N6-isopentenyl adenosine(37)-C2)-methylthiotransferase MiaB [Endomicrobiales bacterium]|nr:tRNA (N6-isopentenyl adenosine(37)-C2)-methylthiotransferase MiaB [Endomicrobiales bacterium]
MIENAKKYYIQTYGCQMNVADSNLMANHLNALGLKSTDNKKEADIIIVNTCTVRDHAEHRALSYVGKIKDLKKRNPDLKIVVAGCVAERLGENIKKRFSYVDLVFGAKSIEGFDKVFDKLLKSPSNPPLKKGEKEEFRNKINISKFVTIMRGCDNYCSYCIVPYVRGREKSRPINEIVYEITSMAENETKEVTLLGQNVNSYKSEGNDFADLLSAVNNVKGIERIRYMTSHPKDLSDKLIDAMANLEKVCEHIHLPLQSGSDRILNLMNRQYTSEKYMKLVDKLKNKIPDISLTTDILVGFPGETDEDFQKTLDIINKIQFSFMFAFKYSQRPLTNASKLGDTVAQKDIEERHAKILNAAYGISAEKNAKLIGTRQEVLVEEMRSGTFIGNTRTNKKVFINSEEDLFGRLVDVEITDAKVNSLTGKCI